MTWIPLLFLLFLQPSFGEILSSKKICGPYELTEAQLPGGSLFSKNDLLLICGDESAPGWSEIPRNQALYQIQTVLKSQGYFQSKIEDQGERVLVTPGPRSTVKKVEFKNAPPNFKDVIFRGYKGQAITPTTLSNTKDWTTSRLRSIGYPCPSVSVSANAKEESLTLNLKPGPKLRIIEVDRPKDSPYDDSAWQRYDAFKVHQYFNADLLTLTSRRLLENDMAQFAFFKDLCKLDGAHVFQNVSLAPPRSLLFSFGASTEEAPIAEVEWKHSRLDAAGSNVSANLYGSPRRQSLKMQSELYWFHFWKELYFFPGVEIRRENEPNYKTLSQHFQWGLGHRNDDSRHRYSFRYTPMYTVEKTLEGAGPTNIQYFSFRTSLTLTSHYFEYFKTTPQQGYQLNVDWSAQREGIESPLSLDQFNFSGTWLSNYGKWDPPLAVLGVRFRHSVNVTSSESEVPFTYRLYLGGKDDIRGFSRNSINNLDQGYRTVSYLGLESRFLEVLPYKIQPYLFYDFAKVGVQHWSWDQSIYASPGFGLRWQSPIGSFRGSLSRGMISQKDEQVSQPKEQWNFILTYGQEF